ncbi:Flagellar biosynthetic protein FliQ [Caulifigura coniformis]|uniref:Flagellar biosynthetic protein FliQ n=1 Tax=Caulifigura coniformis TaxID=2527983 RepID=A0A517SHZ3_9PLAN|nr:flagellar biosynthetic protein FliQ [Caulifigura coniformis]QDT55742.1 Flagellar biosynthetic protein FliQ [Caulifigura coniformis]
MTIDTAQDLLRTALMTGFVIAAPVLGAVLLVSLVVNVLQTMTQLHDHALSFVPRLLATGLVLLLLLPWILGRVSEYATEVYRSAGHGP